MHVKHRSGTLVIVAFLSLVLLFVQGCATSHEIRHETLTLTIAHINDTHSHLDPTEVALTANGTPVKVPLGGFARLKTAIDDLRGQQQNVLFLHGGDMVQGTLYFTHYGGKADAAFMNLLGVDVMCAGNHEFDRGPELLAELIDRLNFPMVSSNVDVSQEPILAGRLPPFVIKQIANTEVGIIGLTTMEAPFVSNPGPNVTFADPAASVRKAVEALNAHGVRRIILLSHSGYEEDIVLAKKVPGLSLIVGGHTHSLLGDAAAFPQLGLIPDGPYPTIVKNPLGKNVLVVQSWEWAKLLGVLKVTLNPDGEPVAWSGRPQLLAGTPFRRNNTPVLPVSDTYAEVVRALKESGVVAFYDEDPYAKKMLETYSRPLQEMMHTNIAAAAQNLERGNNTGPGPLVADAMLWKTRASGTQVAIQNTGGIRRDIPAGPVSVATVYELLPFNNTLVILDLKGSELKAALEEAINFQLATSGKEPYLYVAGATFRIDAAAPKGSRIRELRVKLADGSYTGIDNVRTCRIVTNNYIARGGDGIPTLGAATGYRIDTGFTDAEVFLEYLKSLGTIHSPTEKRISSAMPEMSRNFSLSMSPALFRRAA